MAQNDLFMPNAAGTGMGSGDGGFDWSSLLTNRTFLSFLSKAGVALNPRTAPIDALTQQTLGAQSRVALQKRFANMLSGGELKEGEKFNRTNKGITMFAPESALGSLSQGDRQESVSLANEGARSAGGSGETYADPTATQQPSQMANLLAGGQPDISGADIGGMSAEQVAQSLRDYQVAKRDIQTAKYQDALIEKMQQPTAPKDERTNAIKNFEYDRENFGYKGTLKEHMEDDVTGYQADYNRYAKEERDLGREPDLFNTWLLKLKKAGKTEISIGETVAKTIAVDKAKAGLKGQNYFKDPKWTDDVSKYISSEEVQGELFALDPKNQSQRQAEKTVSFIENKISAGGGTIEDVIMLPDGRTMQWTVRWPTGDVETINHGVRN